MKLRYYADTDSAYIKFSDRPGVETCEVTDGLNVDLGADGELIGIEMECASKHLDQSQISSSNRPDQRVALIVPSTNTVMEPDLYRHLPDGVTVHTSRMLLEGSVTIEAEELMLDLYLPQCARQVGTLRPDVVVFGCTSAGALRGPAYEQQLAEELAQTTGAPTVTIMGAVVAELRRLEVRSVAVLTPYSEEINDTIKESLEASGFTVPYINGMDVKGAFNIAAVTPEEIIAYIEEQLAGVESDCLFVSCANLRSVDVLPELAAVAGRPVVTSNQAVLESVKRVLAR